MFLKPPGGLPVVSLGDEDTFLGKHLPTANRDRCVEDARCRPPQKKGNRTYYAKKLILVRIVRVNSNMLTSKFWFSLVLISNILV